LAVAVIAGWRRKRRRRGGRRGRRKVYSGAIAVNEKQDLWGWAGERKHK
jgi:hypothetical protein